MKGHQAPLKRLQTSTRLHGATFQKTVIFIFILLSYYNLTEIMNQKSYQCRERLIERLPGLK
jgi:hypothetical protein